MLNLSGAITPPSDQLKFGDVQGVHASLIAAAIGLREADRLRLLAPAIGVSDWTSPSWIHSFRSSFTRAEGFDFEASTEMADWAAGFFFQVGVSRCVVAFERVISSGILRLSGHTPSDEMNAFERGRELIALINVLQPHEKTHLIPLRSFLSSFVSRRLTPARFARSPTVLDAIRHYIGHEISAERIILSQEMISNLRWSDIECLHMIWNRFNDFKHVALKLRERTNSEFAFEIAILLKATLAVAGNWKSLLTYKKPLIG